MCRKLVVFYFDVNSRCASAWIHWRMTKRRRLASISHWSHSGVFHIPVLSHSSYCCFIVLRLATLATLLPLGRGWIVQRCALVMHWRSSGGPGRWCPKYDILVRLWDLTLTAVVCKCQVWEAAARSARQQQKGCGADPSCGVLAGNCRVGSWQDVSTCLEALHLLPDPMDLDTGVWPSC